MQFSSVEIIYNPKSTGNSRDLAEDLQQKLAEKLPKLTVRLHATQHAGHAEELACSLAKKYPRPLIISSSGDGGYNEIINGAMQAQRHGATPVCAVLAAGNANDHSRTLMQTPLVELIQKQQPVALDLLKVTVTNGDVQTERYAHSYVGFGLTPVIAAQLNKTNLNALKELSIVVRTFYKYRPVTFKYKSNVVRLDSVIFANIGEMAKVFTVSKDSKPDDGLFEAVTVRHQHKFRLLRNLLQASIGGLDTQNQYQEISFQALTKMPAQLDGEVVSIPRNATIEITIEPGVLSTLIG